MHEIPSGVNDETKERIKSLVEYEEEVSENWERTSCKVTKELCNIICEMYSDGISPRDITDCLPISSHNTVYYHVRGDCNHEYRSKLTYDECGWMRVYARKGAPSSSLAVLYNVHKDRVSHHVTGKCRHEDGIEPVSASKLRSNGYSTPDYVTKECPVCGDEFEHKEYKSRTTCSNKCNYSYAGKSPHKKI